LERVARERDRPAKEREQRKRRESVADLLAEPREDDDDGRPHIDVRV
jgi:hypothetical protein